MAHSYQVFLNRPVTYPKDIRRVAIIANPVSGGKLGRTIATKIQHELLKDDVDVRVEFTKGPGDGRRIAQELQWKELDAIFIAGGDGTVHEVVNGLFYAILRQPETYKCEDIPPLAFLPVGSGNTLSFDLGIRQASDSMKAFRNKQLRSIDVVQVVRPSDASRLSLQQSVLKAHRKQGRQDSMLNGAPKRSEGKGIALESIDIETPHSDSPVGKVTEEPTTSPRLGEHAPKLIELVEGKPDSGRETPGENKTGEPSEERLHTPVISAAEAAEALREQLDRNADSMHDEEDDKGERRNISASRPTKLSMSLGSPDAEAKGQSKEPEVEPSSASRDDAGAIIKTENPENETVFSVNMIGWGLGATVLKTANKLRCLGKGAKYNCAALCNICCLPRLRANLVVDGDVEEERRIVMLQGQVTVHMGDKMPFCPRAKVDDGKVDIVTVDGGRNCFAMCGTMSKAKKGKHVEDTKIILYNQAMQFTLRPLDTEKSASYLLNVDGELFEKFVPFTAITLPKALRVFA